MPRSFAALQVCAPSACCVVFDFHRRRLQRWNKIFHIDHVIKTFVPERRIFYVLLHIIAI